MNKQEPSEGITAAFNEIKRLRQERQDLCREVFGLRTRLGQLRSLYDQQADSVKQLRQERDELSRQLNSITGFYARVELGSWRVREWTEITSWEQVMDLLAKGYVVHIQAVDLLAKGYVVHVQAGPPALRSDTSGHNEAPL